MRFEQPTIIDHGSIAEHTFFRCESGSPQQFMGQDPPPKDFRDFPLDKFGECSEPAS